VTDAVDAVRAIVDRGGQIGEHRSRRIGPRPPIGINRRCGDPRREPGQVRQFPQRPYPGVRYDTMAVRGHLHPRNRCDTLHLRSAFLPAT
jgi:hypothetical protein